MAVEAHSSCSICISPNPKYKCPTCRAKYCSSKCCTGHKEIGCTSPPAADADEKLEPSNHSVLYSNPALLKNLPELEHNASIREYLKDPYLRNMLQEIDKSNNPTDLIAQAMLQPLFVEFSTECLKVVQSGVQ